MSDIEDFIKDLDKNNPFLTFEEGEPVVGVFKSVNIIDDTFNKGEKTLEYTITVDGIDKSFKSKSGKLARQIKGFKEGETIRIVKTGTSLQTIWYVDRKEEK
jgi:hypothetical protein